MHEKKLLLLLGLCAGAAQAAVIVTYPYAAPRAVAIAPAPIVVAPAPVAVPAAIVPVAHPLALTAGAVATGAYRHHERQDAYDERSIICSNNVSMSSIIYRRSASIILIRVIRVND
ncbi:hypothetical protein ACI6PW_26190 [Serratia marcescens]|uniref:hypothetical protein n=1 Tax=Serratia marcescens TaxID=615 RepID=UPI003ED9BB09